MLDWRIDTFLDVCETLNYTHTAVRLNITQPAVSQHISWLEKQLGVQLFIRQGRSLCLTEQGGLVKEVLQAQRNDESLLRRELTMLDSGNSTLSIGATLTAGEYLLAHPLARWCKAHPQVHVRVDTADTQDLLQKLDAGEIDCALVEGIFDSTRYSYKEWSHERMVCVEAANNKLPELDAFQDLSGNQAITVQWDNEHHKNDQDEKDGCCFHYSDLLDRSLIIREPGSGSRAVLEASLARRNLVPDSFARVIEAKGVGLALEMAAGGLGITFAYESAVVSRIAAGELQELSLEEEGLDHSICFVWRRETYFSERFEKLFKELRGVM